jgi:hypothetical protein
MLRASSVNRASGIKRQGCWLLFEKFSFRILVRLPRLFVVLSALCKYRDNVVTCISDYRRGFHWIIEFIDNLQMLTTSNNNSLANSCTRLLTAAPTKSFRLLCFHQPLPGSDFQRRTFSLLLVSELSPCLSYQLLRATAHKE